MPKMKKLPDAEFDVMKVAWSNEPPITTGMVMEQLGNERGWKAQTIISLMLRLVERGFLSTEKNGKERSFYPLIGREEYLSFETGHFLKQYHNNSLMGLVNTLYRDKELDSEDIDELMKWLKERRD